jgi:hypothetical protein
MALLGIPDLPADAFKKEGGKIKLHGGGGGGSQPRETVQTQTSIPEYARPYVERMLGKAEASTNAPYQTYGGQRTAGFTDLQNQAFKGAENLGPAQQIGTGTQMAGISGLQGLTAGGRYAQQATSPGSMQAYMSPYMNLALEPQMREAARRSAMEGQAQQAQAVQRGAFGGSRSGLIEAERQRNLAQQQQDIYGRGMQTAFEQARQAQQFGADLGLRGAGMGLQAAGQLGQLGQQQFGQEEAALRAQAGLGQQQQQQSQRSLDQAYQDFLSQRGYQQQQLAFMSDILRGVPLSQSTQQVYQAPPSLMGQLGGAGVTYLGAKQAGLFAAGGLAGIAANKLAQG